MWLMDRIQQVFNCATLQEVWQLQQDVFAEHRFDRIIYGYSRFFSPTNFGPREDILMLSNHSKEYLKAYTNGEMYVHSPMIKWAAHNSGACSWRWIEENAHLMGEKQWEVLAVNRRQNVTAGYTISFPSGTSRTRGVIAATAEIGLSQDDVDEIWKDVGRNLEIFANVSHLKIISLPIETQRQSLSDRQREALEWVSEGKTTLDIAAIMNVSAAMVEKHLRLAREKLGVDTTAQAIAKASFFNQIHVVAGDANAGNTP